MAIVEWAPNVEGFHGRYIGSAFGVSATGDTLMRNPHVARKIVARQQRQQSFFAGIQRAYRQLSQQRLGLYNEMGQNNPYVNSLGVLRYPNRYHKWIQVQRYVVLYAGSIAEVEEFSDPTPPTNIELLEAVATLITTPVGYRIEVVLDKNIIEFNPDEDTAAFVYMSRPLAFDQTQYSSTFHFIGAPRIAVWQTVALAFPAEVMPVYQEGDRVLVQVFVINVNRGFIISSARFFVNLLQRPFP